MFRSALATRCGFDSSGESVLHDLDVPVHQPPGLPRSPPHTPQLTCGVERANQSIDDEPGIDACLAVIAESLGDDLAQFVDPVGGQGAEVTRERGFLVE